MTPQQVDVAVSRPHPEGAELRLTDLLVSLGHQKGLLLGLPVLAGVVAAVIAFFLPPGYTSATSFIIPQPQQSLSSAALQQLGSLAGFPAIGGAGLRKPEDLYIALLQTDSLQNAVIDRFDLIKRLGVRYREDARRKLAQAVTIRASRGGLLIIEASDADPAFAAQLANAHVEELRRLLSTIAVTEAQQRRVFFEQQLVSAKEGLIRAELGMKQTQERTGLIALDKQGEAIIRAAAELRAQIASREVQLQGMRNFATPQNAEFQRLSSEISGLRDQLVKLESGQVRGKGDIMLPTGKVPEVGLEYVRALREVKYQEAIFELLVRQFELAKVEEAREGPAIQQVDRAVPPERRSKPKRRQIVVSAIMVAALMAIFIAIVRSRWTSWRADAEGARQWQALKGAWRIRRSP